MPLKCFYAPNLFITSNDVVMAIDEIKTDSSCPKYSIPAIVLKQCKHSLKIPLSLFWQKSFNLDVVPKRYKEQLIIPLFKKGLRNKPENYRPVSLTSHVVKVFERILRKKLINYLYYSKLALFRKKLGNYLKIIKR